MAEKEISCRSCRFCRAYEAFGECRKNPPMVSGSIHESAAQERLWAVWPQINLDGDWCGEWMPPADPYALPF